MLNLDTHILLSAWAGELSRKEETLLAGERWSISSIVLWEITKLHQLGRITFDLEDPECALALADLHIWQIDIHVCRAMKELDFKSDPADEIIAATSIVNRVPLVTRDQKLRKSKIVPLAG